MKNQKLLQSRFLSNERGLTLIELMVALAISGIVLAAVTQLFISSNEFYTVQSKVANVQQDIRAAMGVMARDIRMAGYDNFDGPANSSIDTANSTTLEFSYDNATVDSLNYGYQFDAAEKRLEYDFPNVSNYRGFTEENSVRSMQFDYNTTDTTGWIGNPPQLDKVRQVRVGMCGQISGSYADTFNNTYCFNNTITLRNMGS